MTLFMGANPIKVGRHVQRRLARKRIQERWQLEYLRGNSFRTSFFLKLCCFTWNSLMMTLPLALWESPGYKYQIHPSVKYQKLGLKNVLWPWLDKLLLEYFFQFLIGFSFYLITFLSRFLFGNQDRQINKYLLSGTE